jgi:hypothetical protein
MNQILKQFAIEADSASVNRLVALSAIVNTVPPVKMEKIKTIRVTWRELEDELVPELDMEFFQ